MSNIIEKNVVEMDFDNSKFEKNVKESMSTIDKLKQALKFEESKEALTTFAKQLNGLDFSGLKDSIDTISSRFTNLGIVGATVISRITNEVITGVSNITRSIAGMVTQGGLTRAMNIEKAKFQLEGLGIAWKEIQDDIDYGVKDTAYGLDAAANVAAQLVTSGVQIGDDMKESLRAISGVASMTGTSYEEIGQIFTAVAGQGKVMTQQLRQLELRGLNAAGELAKAMGVSEAAVREMVTKGQVDFATFSKAMDQAFGEHAKDSNKTLTGTLSNIRSAWSRVGAEFYQPIIRNEGELVEFLNAYRVKINEVKSALEPVAELTTGIINNLLKSGARIIESIDIKTRINNASYAITELLKAFKLLWPRIAYFGRQIKGVFDQFFPKKEVSGFKDTVNKIAGYISNFNFNSKTIEKVKSIFRGLFSVVKYGITIFKNLAVVFKPIAKYIVSEAGKMLDIAAAIGDAIAHFLDKTVEIKSTSEVFNSVVASVEQGVHKILHGFGLIFNTVENFFDDSDRVIAGISDILEGVLYTVIDIVEAITGLDLSKLEENLFHFIEKATGYIYELTETYSNFGGGFKGFSEVIRKVLGDALDAIKEFIKEATGLDISVIVSNITNAFDKAKEKVVQFAEKIESPIKKIGELFTFVKDRVKELEETLHGLGQKAAIGLGKILESPVGSFVALKSIGPIIDTLRQLARDGALGSLSSTLFNIKNSLDGMLKSMNGTTMMQTALALLAFSYAMNVFAGSVSNLSNVPDFEKTIGAFSEMLVAMGAMVGGIVWILKTLQTTNIDSNKGDAIFKTFDKLKKTVTLSMGNVIATTLLIVAIAKAIETMSNALVNISSLEAEIDDNLMALGGIVAMLVMLVEGMKKLSKLKPAEGVSGKFFIIYAGTLVLVAEAVKLMSEAFVSIQEEMSKIHDIDGVFQAITSLLTVFGILAALTSTLNRIRIANVQNLIQIGIGVTAMSVGIRILVEAVKAIKDLGAEDALMGLIVVFVLLEVVMQHAASIAGKSIGLKTSIAFLAMATAIALLVHEIKVLSQIPFMNIVMGFNTLVAIMAVFVATAKVFQAELKSLSAAGFAILEFAAALWIVMQAIKSLKSLNPEQLMNGVLTVLGALVTMSLVLYGLSSVDLSSAGLALLEVSAAMYIMAQAIKVLGETNIVDIAKGSIGLIVFLAALCGVVTKFTMATAGAQALLLVAAALGVLALSIAILAPLGGIAVGVGVGLIAFITSLGVAAAIASAASAVLLSGATTIAIALGLIGVGLLLVTAPIALFAVSIGLISATAHQAAEGLKVFVDTLIQLAASASTSFVTMTRLSNILVMAAAGIAASGAALIIMGVGLLAFGAGAVVAAAGATLLAGGITLLAGALDYLISVLQAANLGVIVESIGLDFGANLTKSAASGINGGMPLVIDAISALVKNCVGTFNKEAGINSPSTVFAESGKYLDMGLAEGIIDNKTLVEQATKELGQTTSKSLTTELVNGTEEGSKTLTEAVKNFSNITEQGSVSAGYNIGAGFAKGIKQIAPAVKQYAINLAKSAMNSMKAYLRIKSPSRLAMEIGEYTGEGFAIGIENTGKIVDNSATDLGKTAEQSLITALAAAYDNLTSEVTDPTIKPVLDLSEIQNGVSSIDSMLSRDYASSIAANYKSNRDYTAEQAQANASLMSGLNDNLISAIAANGMSDLPINVTVQLAGDAAGVFRLVLAENQRQTNMYGASPLLRG